MFVRFKTSNNSPKKSVQIVESFRDGKKVRQRIVRHTGMAYNDQELKSIRDLAEHIKIQLEGQYKANLIVIDDIMLFPVQKDQAVNLFNFINQLYENTSFIITTNKMPAEWAKMLDDEVLTTALLDRLLYRCEIINLSGKSYRMKNREIFFQQEN